MSIITQTNRYSCQQRYTPLTNKDTSGGSKCMWKKFKAMKLVTVILFVKLVTHSEKHKNGKEIEIEIGL